MYCSLEEAWPQWGTDIQRGTNIQRGTDIQLGTNIQRGTDIQRGTELGHHTNLKSNNPVAIKNIESFSELDKPIVSESPPTKSEILPINLPISEQLQEHQDILDHIHNCEHCMREIYKRYNCGGKSMLNMSVLNQLNINSLVSKENKEIVTIMLLGLLVILILQLFRNN